MKYSDLRRIILPIPRGNVRVFGGTMEALRRMILEKGKGIGNDIVKVDMFLNHRIDTALLFQMGEVWADEFRNEKPETVLTV